MRKKAAETKRSTKLPGKTPLRMTTGKRAANSRIGVIESEWKEDPSEAVYRLREMKSKKEM